MNIAFIPARGGSKSIKNKNIKDFCGKPLIFWNLISLQELDLIDKIVVATDSVIIKSIVNSFFFSKVEVYDRDKKNATDTSSTESVILEYFEKYDYSKDDIFVLVQATSPFTQSYDFQKALKYFNEKKIDSLLSGVRSKRFFWDNKCNPINYDYKNRPRRQDFDGIIMENGAFYINTVGNIVRDKNRLSGKIGIYEMSEYTSIEIDEEDDWLIAEKLMYKYVLNDK